MEAQSDTETGVTVDAIRRRPGERGHLPLRIAPMLLIGMILVVLSVLATTVF